MQGPVFNKLYIHFKYQENNLVKFLKIFFWGTNSPSYVWLEISGGQKKFQFQDWLTAKVREPILRVKKLTSLNWRERCLGCQKCHSPKKERVRLLPHVRSYFYCYICHGFLWCKSFIGVFLRRGKKMSRQISLLLMGSSYSLSLSLSLQLCFLFSVRILGSNFSLDIIQLSTFLTYVASVTLLTN